MVAAFCHCDRCSPYVLTNSALSILQIYVIVKKLDCEAHGAALQERESDIIYSVAVLNWRQFCLSTVEWLRGQRISEVNETVCLLPSSPSELSIILGGGACSLAFDLCIMATRRNSLY